MLNKLVRGRLGNQMFQYAAMRAIQYKYFENELLNLDFSLTRKDGKKENGFDNALSDFKLNNKVVFDQKVKTNFIQKMILGQYFISYKLLKLFTKKEKYEQRKYDLECKWQKIMNRNGLFFFSYGFFPFDFEKVKTKNKIFAGFYESIRYFDDIKDILQKEFEPKHDKIKENQQLYDVIENTNSVCVSIRRGDFLAKEHIDRHFVCDSEYFYKAIDMIKKEVREPRFIVFSDDIEWVKNNMKFPENTLFETGKDPVYEKLRLMYSCKNFILSNSTFSWWAQFLCKNEDKIVVAPSIWQNFGCNPDIYDKTWKIIEMKRGEKTEKD